MLNWLQELSAFAIFLAISGLGFLILLISLLFGELFEHLDFDGDADFDHDAELGHGGPGFFSIRVMSVFVTAFGGFGAVGVHYGLSSVAASGVGFLSGLFFGSVIFWFGRFLYSQQATSEVRTADLIGQTARVVVAIPEGGVGQVRCRIGETVLDKIARTRDGQPVAENSLVRIEEILGETVIVKRE